MFGLRLVCFRSGGVVDLLRQWTGAEVMHGGVGSEMWVRDRLLGSRREFMLPGVGFGMKVLVRGFGLGNMG